MVGTTSPDLDGILIKCYSPIYVALDHPLAYLKLVPQQLALLRLPLFFPPYFIFALWETALLTSDVALDRMISAVAGGRLGPLLFSPRCKRRRRGGGAAFPSTSVGKFAVHARSSPCPHPNALISTLGKQHGGQLRRETMLAINHRAALSDSRGTRRVSSFPFPLALSHLSSSRFFSVFNEPQSQNLHPSSDSHRLPAPVKLSH